MLHIDSRRAGGADIVKSLRVGGKRRSAMRLRLFEVSMPPTVEASSTM